MSDERMPPQAPEVSPPPPPPPPPASPPVLERTVLLSPRMATRWIAWASGLAGLGLGFGLGALVFAHHHRPSAAPRPAVVSFQPDFAPRAVHHGFHHRRHSTAFLGVAVVDGDHGGARITEVVPGSPAEKAGLEAGDVITTLGKDPGQDIASAACLVNRIRKMSPGDEIDIKVVTGKGAGRWLRADLGRVQR